MTEQIIRKKCTVCGQFIYLHPDVLSLFGSRVPLNANGQPHNPLHTFIHNKALEIRNKRKYLESLDAVSEELEAQEETF